ncbi:thiamine pyrophosphate-dependent enzyme [Actinopolymorpha sp. B9G3]|uniref:thiamine pyrophosphate-dependent enzyme n=1 Tax=Actinopolymorpha sp. B9G3 TaxID=3158970 RepID=UPI0032D8CBAE
MSQNVARTVVRLLADAGVRTAYTVPGESFLSLLDELDAEPRIRLVSTRHESGAAFMAEAEGKLTGRPTLALASRGPGATNLAIGIHTAHQDQTPVIAILGQVESDVRASEGREGFQEVDLAALYAPLTVWSHEPSRPADVPRATAEALTRMYAPRIGPVALSVPADFWAEAYDGEPPKPTAPAPSTPEALAAATQDLAAMIATAKRPVAIAGPGDRVGRESLRRASERFGFGVYVAFRRQDAFGEDHPHFLGHLGLGTTPAVLEALDDADLVMVLGTRLDAITSQEFRYPLPGQRLVILGRGLPEHQPASGTVRLDADPQAVLDALAGDAGHEPGGTDWHDPHQAALDFSHHAARVGSRPDAVTATRPDAGAGGIHPADVITTLRRIAPPDVILTNDAGNFSGFFHRYWRFQTSHRLLGPCNGAMGYSVPAAVAAKLAAPDRTVVALVGDGGILMTGQEIETAVRHGAPIVVLAFSNRMYGTIAMHQARAQGRLAGIEIGALDLARWAEGLGAQGFVLDDPTAIEDTLRAALASGRPCVVDIRTDPDVIAPERLLSHLLDPGQGRA